MTNPHPPMPTPAGGSPPPNTPIAPEPGHTLEYVQRQDVSSPWSPGPPPSAPQGHHTGGPWQPAPQQPAPPGEKPRRAVVVAAAIVALVAVFAAGIGGVFVGSRLNTEPADQQQTQASPPAPTDVQVNTATVDLCTRFAAAYRAMPVPQNTGLDVIPTLNYIADALRDNPFADSRIRDAMQTSLRLARDQASYLMKSETPRGAIQPATGWTPEASNAADQRVWDLCRAYGA